MCSLLAKSILSYHSWLYFICISFTKSSTVLKSRHRTPGTRLLKCLLWPCHFSVMFGVLCFAFFVMFCFFASVFLLPCHQLHSLHLYSLSSAALTHQSTSSVFSLPVGSCSLSDPHRHSCRIRFVLVHVSFSRSYSQVFCLFLKFYFVSLGFLVFRLSRVFVTDFGMNQVFIYISAFGSSLITSTPHFVTDLCNLLKIIK